MKYTPHISGAAIAFLLMYLIGLIQQDHPVISYDRQYSTNHVVAGQVVFVQSDVNKSDACSSTIERKWLDQNGNIILVRTEEVAHFAAGHELYKASVEIPLNAQPGILRQRVKTIFYCNWLQRGLNIGSEFIMPDVIFEVSKKET